MQMLGLAEFFFEASGIAPSFSSTFLNRCLSLHLHLQVFAFTCCTRRLSIDNIYICVCIYIYSAPVGWYQDIS